MKIKDWSDRLIWATILITVIRYMAAFAASDVGIITGFWSEVITFLLSLTGLGMGILDTVGGGLLFNGWSRVFPKSGNSWSLRFKILTLCVLTLVFSGLIILVPFTMSRLSHESVLSTLGGKFSIWSWVWSSMVNLIPYVLIAGIFTGNKMVTSLEEETSSESSKNLPNNNRTFQEHSKKLSPDWRKVREGLSKSDLEKLAMLSPEQMRQYSSETGFTYKTISNWRNHAREELGRSKEN